jgi:hypothetical protein
LACGRAVLLPLAFALCALVANRSVRFAETRRSKEEARMPYSLPGDRMPEAEVSLRLAFHLLDLPGSQRVARVAIDGAQVKVGRDRIFPIVAFLAETGWTQVRQRGSNAWQGDYVNGDQHLIIHSRPGVGDVVMQVGDQRVRAECKGGPLVRSPSSQEYPILRRALGQVITVQQVDRGDVLLVAVPQSPKLRELASRWRDAPLVQRAGIQIVLVGRDGSVEGLDVS